MVKNEHSTWGSQNMADNAITRAVDNLVGGALERMGWTKAARSMPLFNGVTPVGGLRLGNLNQGQRERLAALSSWVYSDIDAIGKEASTATLEIYERNGEDETEIKAHPFEALWRRPNFLMSQQYLTRYLIWWLKLRGEAYIWQVFDAAGELAELWPVPSNLMWPIPDAQQYISSFGYQLKSGKAVKIPREQICYLRYPNPFDYHRGMSLPVRMSVELDTAAQKWNRETLEGGGAIPSIIALPAELNDAVYQAAKAEIIEQIQAGNRYIVARSGDLKIAHMAATQKELEFMAGREFTREEIDRIFGIPAGYWAKDANRANIEGAKATMIENAVWPDLQMIAGEVTAQIVQGQYGRQYLARFADIRPRDRRLEVTEYRTYSQDRTIDENRDAIGLGPLDLAGQTDVPVRLLPPARNASAALLSAPGAAQAESMALSGGGLDVEPRDSTGAEEDLKTWRSIELRRAKRGESPGYAFKSELIPEHIKTAVLKALTNADGREEVTAAFAAGFRLAETGPYYP